MSEQALHIKYRPHRLKQVLGQEEAVTLIRRKKKARAIPHAIMLHGPYGTGKTTLARIIAKALDCVGDDFTELNSANVRGINDIRAIQSNVGYAPLNGESRVWLLDEVHQATTDAQNLMLKLLEEPPDHAYFILATTDPEKLIQGIHQRCLKLKLNPIADEKLEELIISICEKEGIKFSRKVLEELVEYSDGSARQALQLLDKVRELDTEAEQLAVMIKDSVKTQSVEIARRLLKTKTKWKDIAVILKELQKEPAEDIRRMVIGYASKVLMNADVPRAFRIIESFRDNTYDCGFAGIVGACYEVIVGG